MADEAQPREWFTASELAEFRLPGLPGTDRGIARRASSERWRSRPRKGRGGGREYSVASLPLRARLALINSQLPRSALAASGAHGRLRRERLLSLARDVVSLLDELMRELRKA